MSAGFHRLGTNVEGKDTGYRASSLPIGVHITGLPVLPSPTPKSTAPKVEATLIAGEMGAPVAVLDVPLLYETG